MKVSAGGMLISQDIRICSILRVFRKAMAIMRGIAFMRLANVGEKFHSAASGSIGRHVLHCSGTQKGRKMLELLLSVAAIGSVVVALAICASVIVFILVCEGLGEGGIGAPGSKATKDEMRSILNGDDNA